MKKLFALVIAALMLIACTACAGGGEKDRLAQIKDQGYINFVTEPYFAPYEFIDPSLPEDEQIVGMDIEIAKAIAEEIGVELKITGLDYTAVLAGVAEGKYDLSLSAIAYNPGRAEAMNLSDVYLASDAGYGFIVRAEDVDKYNSIEAVKDAVIITQSGSVQEALYKDNIGECKEFKLVDNMTNAYLAVAEGNADVCVCSTDSAQLYADANGNVLAVPEFRFDVDPSMNGTVAAAPKEGTDSLMEIVNKVIADLQAEGKIEAWNEEYTAYAEELGVQ